MLTLLAMLTPIALIDSTSIVPLAVMPLLILLAGKRPYLGCASFILSIFLTYVVTGFLIMHGLSSLFEQINEYARRAWSDPNTLEMYLQLVIGVVLTVFGYRLAIPKAAEERAKTIRSMTAGQAFGFGMIFTVVGLWGAFPYFAAIDQILQEDLAFVPGLLVLIYYNVIFVLPLLALVLVHFIWKDKSEPLFHKVQALLNRWGKVLLAVILLLLGLALIADAISLIFFAKALLPT